MKRLLQRILFTILFISVFSSMASAVVIIATVNNGDFRTGSTWSGGVVPTTGDIAIIPSGITVVFTTAYGNGGNDDWFQPAIYIYGTLKFISAQNGAVYSLMAPQLRNAANLYVFLGGTILDNQFPNAFYLRNDLSIYNYAGSSWTIVSTATPPWTTTEFSVSPENTPVNFVPPVPGTVTGRIPVNANNPNNFIVHNSNAPPVIVPVAVTNTATSVSSSSATFNGALYSTSVATSGILFRYSTASNLSGSSTINTSTTSLAINAAATSLTAGPTLLGGTTYYYRLEGTNSAGTAVGETQSFLTLPSTPATPTVSANGANGYTLNWSAVTGAASYRLDIATDNGFTSILGSYNNLTVNSTSQAITGLTANTTYYFRLRAVNATGTSSNSTTGSQITTPVAPSTPTASVIGSGGFTISWSTVTGATSYRLDVATDNGFAAILGSYNDLTVNATSQVVTGLTANTTYYYRIRAVNAGGAGASSTAGNQLTLTANPTIPIASTITTTGFTVSWTAVTGATSYRLDVATDNGFASILGSYNDLTVAGTSQSVSALSAGTTYYFRVRALNSAGTSGNSTTASQITLPTTPSTPTASVITATGFTANWTAVTGAASYQLDVSTVNNFASFVSGYNNLSVTGTSQSITGLTEGTTYYYRVRAVNAAGNSAYSTVSSVITLPATPTTPTASGVTTSGFTVNWSAVTGAASYRLDVSTDGFSSNVVGYSDLTVNTTSQAVTGLASGNYSFRVRAVNASGASANSPVGTQSLNSPPVIGGMAAGQAVTDKTTVLPFSTVTITDAETAQTQSISVTLDVAAKGSFTTLNGFTNAGSGIYTYSGNAANAQTAIRGLVFTPTPNRVAVGSTETTTFTISVNDGVASAVTNNTTTVVSTSINDAPVLATGSTLTYTENAAATAINTGITVSDLDHATLPSASVSISGNYQNGQDLLSFTNNPATMGNVLGSFNTTTGVMTLTSSGNTATLAQWQSALRAVLYSNSSETPSTLARTVDFTVSDGSLNSNTVTSTINITAVNDAPVLAGSATVNYTENAAALAINSNITVSDVDHATLSTAVVSITGNFSNGQDVLSFTNNPATMGNVLGSFNTTTGVMTLTSSGSTATLAQWQSVLRAVLYSNSSETPSTLARTVGFLISDGAVNSNTITSTINISATNDAPVLSTGSTLTYSENAAATAINTGITVSDLDHTALSSASVSISGNYQNGQDLLSFTNNPATMGNVLGSFNTTTGVMTLTSSGNTATLAQWQSALRAVLYSNSSETPSTLARTVDFLVSDGAVNSNTITSTINITAVNDAPVLAGSATVNYTENAAAIAINNSIAVSDVDHAALSTAVVSITGNFSNGQDVLSFTNNPATMGNVLGSFNTTTGVMTLTSSGSTATLAQWQLALRAVLYANSSDNPSVLPRTISYVINDGETNSNIIASTINITAVNDLPTVANIILPQLATATFTFNFAFAANTFNDIDNSLTYTARLVGGTSLPTWLTFTNATRSFSGTPNGSDVGMLAIEVIANDGTATIATNFNLMVDPANRNITSATYNGISGILTVTGTYFKANTGGADINLSKFTITGEGGATHVLTSPNVEITNATTFSVSVNTGDKTALAAIFTKNGTLSRNGTTYNIAAAADWITAAPGFADLTGKPITVSDVTEIPVPLITAPTGITPYAATINGTIDPKLGNITAGAFVVSKNADLSNPISVPAFSPVNTSITSSMPATAVSTSLTGLTTNTTYYYQLSATNSSGEGKSAIQSFATLPSLNAYLANLTVDNGVVLDPTFTRTGISYTAAVSNAINSLKVTPTLEETTASIKVNTATVTNATASSAIALAVGLNTITTVVTAEDLSTTKTYTIAINRRAAQTITFAATASTTYGTADFDPGAASTNTGIAIAYSSSDTNVATIVAGKIHIVAPGTVTILANQAGDVNHDAASTVSQTLTINKASQVISFAALVNKTYNDIPFNLNATGGGSNNSLTYVSSNTNVATIIGNEVTIVGAGTTTITASQAGNSNYLAAVDVTQSLVVNKAAATFSLAGLTQTFDGTAKAVTATTAPANLTGVAITYDGSTTIPVNAGTYAVVASLTNDNYTAVNATGALVVGKAAQVITWTAPSNITYGTTLSATQLNATAEGTLTYTPALGTVLGGGAQTLSVTAAATTNYEAATKTVSITVDKAAQVITWTAPANIVYGTALTATQLNATAEGTLTYTPALGTILGGGAQTLIVTAAATSNYEAATKTVSITVDKAAQVITWTAPTNITYGTALSSTQLNATADGTLTYTPALGTILGGGAQTLSVTAAATSNYEAATKTVSITVDKAAQVITWTAPANITYGTALSAAHLNATADGTLTYTPALGTVLGGGTHTLSVTAAATSNYEAATKTVSITVDKAAQVITWTAPANITYGTALSAAHLNATAEGTLTYTPALGTVLGAGAQTLSVTAASTSNYEVATKTVAITVDKAAQTIVWTAPANITYGTALSATQLNATAEGTLTYIPALGTVLGGGTHTLSVTAAATSNYEAATKTVVITVDKAAAIISLAGLAQTFDGTAKPVSATTAPASLTGVAITYDGSTTIPTNAGTYAVVASLTNDNYTAINATGTLVISKAAQVITWTAPANITYGTALTATQLNATAEGTLTYTPALGTILGGEAHTLSVTAAATANHEAATKTIAITVDKAAQTIVWNLPANITYGTALSGVQLNATAEGTLTYTPALGTVLGAGLHTLSVTAAATSNYEAATKTVAIMVDKAAQTIVWTAPANITYGTALSAAQLNATAEGALTYTPALGTILGGGAQTLSVTAAATSNYEAATKTVAITVDKATQTIVWNVPANITYGTALSATQLNATAEGTLTYTPALGTVLGAGAQTLSVTAATTSNYEAATKTVSITVDKAAQVITWTAPANITYGTALSGIQLNATAEGTLTYTPALGTALGAGTQTLSVTAAATSNYESATRTVSITVDKAAQTIAWTAPANIVYGTALTATQLNATAEGTLTYTPALGTVLGAGAQTLSVTAAATSNYEAATKTVSITVDKAAQTIAWNAPANITYGTALSATQLNATAEGTLTYTPALGTVLGAGAQTLSVTAASTSNYEAATKTVAITVDKATATISLAGLAQTFDGTAKAVTATTAPANLTGVAITYDGGTAIPVNAGTYAVVASLTNDNYTAVNATGTLVISKAAQVITWTAPANITYGTALTAAQLNATAEGTLTYTPALGTALGAGAQTLSVTAAATTNYEAATKTVSITVDKAAQTIVWTAPANITYGTALSAAQLNATAEGALTYTPAIGTVLGGGTHTLSVTAAATSNYEAATKTVSITIDKAAQVIAWNVPTNITYGTALSGTQLNATADGTLIYIPAIGTILGAGTQTLSVTAASTSNYEAATKTVVITVDKAVQTIAWTTPANITYGTALSGIQLNATAEGTLTYTPALGTILGGGAQTLSVTAVATSNYEAATKTVSITVDKAVQIITWTAPANITYGTALSAAHLNATAEGTLTYTPALGTVLGAGAQTLSVTAASTSNYEAATKTVSITVDKAPQVITWSAPVNITYGTALSGTQLNATAQGALTYTPALGTILGAGSHTLSITAAATTNYEAATKTVVMTVDKATATISLSGLAQTFDGTAKPVSTTTVPASLTGVAITYAGSTVVPTNAGTYAVVASLTNDNYTAVNATGTLVISKAAQVITWTAPSNITYGTALSATQLNATAEGTLTYTPALGAVLGGGTHTLSVTAAATSNYEAATKTVSITVDKAAQTITWTAPANITYGTALTATQLNATAEGTLTYTPALGTVLGAGLQTLLVTAAATSNYEAATKTVSITVDKAAQTIVWTAPANITYGTALSGVQLNATAEGTLTYTPGLGTILGGGAHTLSVTAAATANHEAATKTIAITVDKVAQTIVWNLPANITYGTALSGVQLNATADGILTYTPALGTVLGGGTHTLSVTAATTSNYEAATKTVSIMVDKAAQTIVWTAPANITYGTALTATQLNATAEGTLTYTPALGTVLGAGLHTLSVTAAATSNYEAATKTVAIMVDKAAQTIVWTAPANITYGTALSAVQLNATSEGALTYTPALGTILGGGAQTLSVTAAATSNYEAATKTVAITVDKATQTIVWNVPANITYGTALSAVQLNAAADGTLTYTPAIGTILGAGLQTLSVTAASTSNYEAATKTVAITVDKAVQTIAWNTPANITYGTALSGIQLNATAEGTLTYTPSIGTILGAGLHTLSVTAASTSNYEAATKTVALSVDKATATISLTGLTQTFDGTAKAVTATTTPANLTGVVITYDGSTTIPTNAGTYAVVASLTNDNYTAINATGTLVIGKVTQTITFAPLPNKTFGDFNFNLTSTGGASGNAVSYTSSNPLVAKVSGNTVTIVGAGTTTITANQAGNIDYAAASNVDQVLTVLQKPVTGAFTAANKIYDGTVSAIITTRSLIGVLSTDMGNVTLIGGTAIFDNIQSGTAKTVTSTGMTLAGIGASNYQLSSVSVAIADISSKQITVTADAKTKTYGDADPVLTYTVPAGSLIGTDAITGALTRATGNGAGIYAINIGTITAGSNYAINYIPANFTISQKVLTITADNQSRLFNTVNPTLTATYNGFVGAEHVATLTTLPILTTTAVISSPVGNYPIIVSGAAATNYSFNYVNGTLTIINNTQSITFAALGDKLSTDAIFTLNATSSAGLTITYTSNDPTIARIVNGNQVEILKAGTVNITASQFGDANYAAAVPVIQSLRILDNPVPVIAITSDLGTSISKGETAKLTATGATTYVWSNANGVIGAQNTAVLTVRPLVNTIYTVTGANQFGRTSTQTIALTVKEDLQSVVIAPSATNIISPNGDGVNDFFTVKNIDAYPNNTMTIFDRGGKTLYKVKSYQNDWDGKINGLALEEGTYYYIVEFGDGKTNAKKGFITIVKE
ncbi:T9SS type B sorting domain-containing protein [Pedobacter polaris]|uniref:T9SS type B sorting domain-containing protein n=1 Tax=Pedobacter polaris TaxID=2571273 RepID=A0A4V5P2V4_9SPHI|nr:MBG domain-containing protein [Pedobacter polaris]TKC09872.1 T9SS type B sorting domain-containing protein [Pedobacter polaris]